MTFYVLKISKVSYHFTLYIINFILITTIIVNESVDSIIAINTVTEILCKKEFYFYFQCK